MRKLTINFKGTPITIHAIPRDRRTLMPPGSCKVAVTEGVTLIENSGALQSPTFRGSGHAIVSNWLNADRVWVVLLQMIGRIPKGSLKEFDAAEKARDEHNKRVRHVQRIIASCQALGIPVPAKVAKESTTPIH